MVIKRLQTEAHSFKMNFISELSVFLLLLAIQFLFHTNVLAAVS